AGVNGSGKHLNWSIGDDKGHNLLSPGANPHENVQFLVFCAAVLRAVNKWQGLLRASIASAGNDHRLGANEAPPAILSIFLDDMATELEKLTKGGKTIEQAAAALLPKVIKENKQIIYNGNGYSAEWQKEAGKRGLLNLKNTVDALPQLVSKDVVAMFEKFKV